LFVCLFSQKKLSCNWSVWCSFCNVCFYGSIRALWLIVIWDLCCFFESFVDVFWMSVYIYVLSFFSTNCPVVVEWVCLISWVCFAVCFICCVADHEMGAVCFLVLCRISSMPFTWWWNWVWNGNPSHLKDQGRVPRQDDAYFLCFPFS
jgi:hypothetical protein